MPRKKTEMVKVRVIGPNCKYGDRVIMPGETATIPAELAEGWILSMRAVIIAAEVKKDGNGTNN